MNVHFNHLYLVIPDQTYRAILVSGFLETAFPGIERRVTTTAAGEHWSGTYFYTRENYIELFPASSGHWEEQAAEGWGGLAFSVDNPGEIKQVADAFIAEFGTTPPCQLRELVLANGQKVNWFYHMRTAGPVGLASFDSWVMEYTPEIYALKGLPVPEDGALTRQAYLNQWNRPRPKKPGIHPPVFTRVTGATLRMGRDYTERFAKVMAVLGYAKREEDGVTIIEGPRQKKEITLRFLPEEPDGDHYRVHAITLEMARPSAAPTTFVFAPGSKLMLKEDLTAEWVFGE
jgi:hypothetical protein